MKSKDGNVKAAKDYPWSQEDINIVHNDNNLCFRETHKQVRCPKRGKWSDPMNMFKSHKNTNIQ